MVKTWGSDGGKADLDGRAGEDHRGERREKKARRIAAGSTLMISDSNWGCLERNFRRGSDGAGQQHVLGRMRQCAWPIVELARLQETPADEPAIQSWESVAFIPVLSSVECGPDDGRNPQWPISFSR